MDRPIADLPSPEHDLLDQTTFSDKDELGGLSIALEDLSPAVLRSSSPGETRVTEKDLKANDFKILALTGFKQTTLMTKKLTTPTVYEPRIAQEPSLSRDKDIVAELLHDLNRLPPESAIDGVRKQLLELAEQLKQMAQKQVTRDDFERLAYELRSITRTEYVAIRFQRRDEFRKALSYMSTHGYPAMPAGHQWLVLPAHIAERFREERFEIVEADRPTRAPWPDWQDYAQRELRGMEDDRDLSKADLGMIANFRRIFLNNGQDQEG